MRHFTFLLFLSVSFGVGAQTGQRTINRVSQMPDLPAPYVMRDWKDVAIKYDQFIYVTPHTGEYFPLIGTRTPINYPALTPIALDTYIGSPGTTQAEGINIIPSMVSATLVGIDKSSQGGINWVEKTKEFFNKANGQNVYLNGANSASGGDWWYDVMPNIFFYQLYSQYPFISDYDQQFTSVADRWLAAVHAMGGNATPWTVPNMNYRAWNLMTMTGKTEGVHEPEAAGGIGWLLYHAYLETGEKKYLDGAQMSLEFLSTLTSNPSYELQLPYGAFIAAKMNAEQGTSYDVPKIINWCFDKGPLRGWGAIVGSWDGKDVDGLIGEANDGGNDYAFALNGFQQAAALVPLIKYDKRFTRDIAKWTLNVANASRFFYRPYPTNQDDLAWSTTNDPDAVIAYEALKERDSHNGNIPLNATGDAKRNNWAETNLGLYGSSSVGYLAAVVETTDVEGILLLDVNKTDFFLEGAYPTYALYNPHATDKMVTLTLPTGSHDVYDAISETVIASAVSGTTAINVKTDEAVMLVYVPAGTSLTEEGGKLYANDIVVDYHHGYDFTPAVRIKSFSAAHTSVEFGQEVTVYLTVENAGEGATYQWADNSGSLGTFSVPEFTWTAPAVEGTNVLTVHVTYDGKTVSDEIVFNVVEDLPEAPIITALSTDEKWQQAGGQIVFTCNALDDNQQSAELTYTWSASTGALTNQTGNQITWQAPAAEGIYTITCEVTDADELTTTFTRQLLVKHAATGETDPFAYYPFNGNVRDYSGNERHATLANVNAAADARGEPDNAYLFNSGTDLISVANNTALNFQDKITLSFWVKATSIPEESFIISHGSWEDRWKVSITPTGYLRWTVKTNTGTKDLDSSFPLITNQFYHFTVVYSGYSMELYAGGELDTFFANSGLMTQSTKSLTVGRKEEGVENYYLRGVIDEVRIYNATVPPDEILTLKDTWNETVTGVEPDSEKIHVYPNPAEGNFFLRNTTLSQVTAIQLFDVNGKSLAFEAGQAGAHVWITVTDRISGIVILKLHSGKTIYHHKIILK